MNYVRKVKDIKYKTLESETIVFFSTIYAVVSLFFVGVVFRFFLPKSYEVYVVGFYAMVSFIFLVYIGVNSRRRTKLNKLPSFDVLELCYFVDNYTGEETGYYWTKKESFNDHAMEIFFGRDIARGLPSHDYLSFMLAERYVVVESVSELNRNLGIKLAKKAIDRMSIYEMSKKW